MKTGGIIIDRYKLAIFKEHLDTAGYRYTEHPGPIANTITLRVSCEWVADLKPIVEAANLAAKQGGAA